jgi:hypothetical protein
MTMVLAADYLSASLLTMLVPIATISAVVAWGVVVIRRHERDRADVEAGHAAAPAAGAADGARAVPRD